MIKLTDNQKTIFYITFTFLFSVAVRMIWVYQFNGVEQFKFNDMFMINTNDGYVWAEGARDILNGFHQNNDHSPIEYSVSVLTAWLVRLLPFSFENIIFYMPVFLSSLLVIPIILIGRGLGKIELGAIAALFASIVHSYYNRTMVGYYDTDMLNIVLPTFLLWSLVLAIKTNMSRYLIFIAFDIIIYRWWYPVSYSLEFAFFAMIAIYTIYKIVKKHSYKYEILMLIFMLFAITPIALAIKSGIVIFMFLLIKFKNQLVIKYIYYILALALAIFFYTGGMSPVIGKINAYIFKTNVLPIPRD